ncbi:hypothetical protein [Nostoc sp.]|uniref:hypothetical protein n=1 Tax=Nostoc sp. TaxID=1180 RepID=UPI002FFCA142
MFPPEIDAEKWSGIAPMPPIQLFVRACAGYEILNSQLQRYLPSPVCGRKVKLIRVATPVSSSVGRVRLLVLELRNRGSK